MRSLFILLFLGVLISCGREKTDTEQPIRPIKYEKVKRSNGLETYTFSGVAKAQNETNLSFKVAGTLASVHVKLGDQVAKGQLIATIDPADYMIQSNQAVSQKEGAVANAKAAEAQLISAKSTFDRVARLYENNSVALSEYQQANAALDAAQSQYDAAHSQVKTADQQLMAASNQVSYTRLTSPMDGMITAMQVEANEIVNAGMLIAMVSSLGHPVVEVGVPEVVINKLRIGQQATVTFPSLPGQIFEAEVVEIAFASERSTTYPIKLKMIRPVDEIRPGMAAEVHFMMETGEDIERNEMVAPLKAIASGTDGNYAFILVPGLEQGVYIAKKVSVDLGAITEEGYLIRSGLNEGDLVAVVGLRSLFDGRKVKLLEN